MRKYLELNLSKPDVRCQVCKGHRYVIVDTLGIGVSEYYILHTHIKVPEEEASVYSSIHWWSKISNQNWKTLEKYEGNRYPKCLESYQEV